MAIPYDGRPEHHELLNAAGAVSDPRGSCLQLPLSLAAIFRIDHHPAVPRHDSRIQLKIKRFRIL